MGLSDSGLPIPKNPRKEMALLLLHYLHRSRSSFRALSGNIKVLLQIRDWLKSLHSGIYICIHLRIICQTPKIPALICGIYPESYPLKQVLIIFSALFFATKANMEATSLSWNQALLFIYFETQPRFCFGIAFTTCCWLYRMQLGRLEVGVNTPLGKSIKHSHCSRQRHTAKLALTEPAKQREQARDDIGAGGTVLPREDRTGKM